MSRIKPQRGIFFTLDLNTGELTPPIHFRCDLPSEWAEWSIDERERYVSDLEDEIRSSEPDVTSQVIDDRWLSARSANERRKYDE